MHIPTLHTPRLLLRPWAQDDLAPFAALNACPEVMHYFPAPLSRPESDALAQRIMDHMHVHGWGLWAVECRQRRCFMGFTGLQCCPASLPFSPAVEAGWRLARRYWGCGYATEAARACLHFAFTDLGLGEVLSFTATGNTRSAAVMRRLGMRRAADFEHPALPEGHPLRTHVLYSLTAHQYAQLQ